MLRKTWQLFILGFWLGASIFGGVTAAYPIIRKKMADLGWLSPVETDAFYATAVFLPGPSFLNLWGAVAMRVGGWPGAIAGQVGLLSPSLLLVCLLPLTVQIAAIATHVDSILRGTVWATAGMLLATGFEGLHRLSARLRWLSMAALGLLLMGVHPLLLLLLAAGAGALWSVLAPNKGGM